MKQRIFNQLECLPLLNFRLTIFAYIYPSNSYCQLQKFLAAIVHKNFGAKDETYLNC